ncbi:MAG: amino acid ABC transporter substrate-binding protein [Tissierellia bacterium]|nr:amino acid ABC transporter substrate-binding protein [Tissierellia bacterium]
MKKIILLLLAFILIASVGCGQKEPVATDEGAKEIWIMGLDDTFAPMGFRDDAGEIVGFDVDLAKAVGEILNVEIKFQPIDWKMKENELNGKNIDLIWNGYSVTEERKEKTTLSEPYLTNRQIILVLKDSEIQKISDLSEKVVAVQEDSGALTAVNDTPELIGIIKDKKCIEFPTNTEAVMDLKAGRTDAVVVDEVFIRYYLRQNGTEDEYRILDEALQEEDYAIAMRKGETDRKEKIDNAIKELKEKGVYDEIYSKWFAK